MGLNWQTDVRISAVGGQNFCQSSQLQREDDYTVSGAQFSILMQTTPLAPGTETHLRLRRTSGTSPTRSRIAVPKQG